MSSLWKCPKCGSILQKPSHGVFGPTTSIVGVATCGSCGAKFQQSEVYGGKYDYEIEGECAQRTGIVAFDGKVFLIGWAAMFCIALYFWGSDTHFWLIWIGTGLVGAAAGVLVGWLRRLLE